MIKNIGTFLQALIVISIIGGVITFIFFLGTTIFIILLGAGAYAGFREYISYKRELQIKARRKHPNRGGPTG